MLTVEDRPADGQARQQRHRQDERNGDPVMDACPIRRTPHAGPCPDAPLPVLDRGRLKRLAEDLQNDDAALQFAASYLKMLPARVERISQALSTGDDDMAMDAVLSLKTSSALIGAVRMERHCALLEHALATLDHAEAAASGEEVTRHWQELEEALGGPPTGA